MSKAFVIIFLLFLLTGCEKQSENQVLDNSKPQIYTSFYAIYDFTQKIGGDKIQLYNIIPTGTEPHDWEPSAKDMANIKNADILFYNGAGLETWIDKIKSSLSDDKIKYIELSSGTELIKNEDNYKENEQEHNNNIADPHVWLNPENVKIQMNVIKNQLCQIDEKNKDYYEQNYNQMAEKLDILNNDYISALSNLKNNNIVVAHQAYAYLCNAYNLNQIALEGIEANSEPSPKKMSEIAEYISKNNIKYIFYEDLINPKIAQSIADETGVQLLELSPYEGLTDEQLKNNDDYFSIMYKNLENLKKALGE